MREAMTSLCVSEKKREGERERESNLEDKYVRE